MSVGDTEPKQASVTVYVKSQDPCTVELGLKFFKTLSNLHEDVRRLRKSLPVS